MIKPRSRSVADHAGIQIKICKKTEPNRGVLRKCGTPNIDPQRVGFSYSKDHKNAPLVSEIPISVPICTYEAPVFSFERSKGNKFYS